jgi:hypothetical protein
MTNRHYIFGFLAFLFPVVLLAADAKQEHTFADFMRVVKEEGKKVPTSLDTAVMKFTDEKNNIEVDLIGAVHIGDKEYYRELNEIFKRYDVLLYELVAEKDARPPVKSDDDERSALSSFQAGMGMALALEHQLDHVDYNAKNFVHADLSPAEFARRAAERGDFLQMIQRMMLLSAQKSGSDAQEEEMKTLGRMIGSLFAPDPALSMKRLLADEMINQLDEAGWIIGGDGSAIITDRNEAALKVLRQEIKNGKKKIAIFYGAAHLPEFAKSLEKDFQMKHAGTDWIIAWDLTKEKSARK